MDASERMITNSDSDHSTDFMGSSGRNSSVDVDDLEAYRLVIMEQHADNILSDLSNKCRLKCIPRPGTSLDRFEESCLVKCSDRYFEAYKIVQTTYVKKIAEVNVSKR